MRVGLKRITLLVGSVRVEDLLTTRYDQASALPIMEGLVVPSQSHYRKSFPGLEIELGLRIITRGGKFEHMIIHSNRKHSHLSEYGERSCPRDVWVPLLVGLSGSQRMQLYGVTVGTTQVVRASGLNLV